MGDTAKPIVKVLNEQTTASKSVIKATDLAKKLQKTMLRLNIDKIDINGDDFSQIKKSV
uniref:Uncharacterized protein n=1 Tax=Magallana gigas TaxID=29159 RepID=K1QW77_MAGGI